MIPYAAHGRPDDGPREDFPAVVVLRTGRGWTVVAPGRSEDARGLVEALSLADLLAEELGTTVEPDRAARRAARGTGDGVDPDADPRDLRLAALERTVAQLEHALAARVAIERAIGVLAERHRSTARAAFELLRGEARSSGRPVQELAREVLDGLEAGPGTVRGAPTAAATAAAAAAAPPPRTPAPRSPAGERTAGARPRPRAAAEGRS